MLRTLPKYMFQNRTAFLVPHCTLKQTVEEEFNLPKKPNRPLSAYVQFLRLEAPAIKAQFPDYKAPDISKQVSKRWKNCPEDQKRKLQLQQEKDSQLYKVLIKNYADSLTDEQKKQIKEAKAQKKAEKLKRGKKFDKTSRSAALGKPKKPVTPFNEFMQTGIKNGRSFSEVSQNWAKLSNEEKFIKQENYKKEWEKYNIELIKWEQVMIAEGHHDVVRKRTLKQASGSLTMDNPKNLL